VRSPLCEAVARSHARRLRAVVSAAPLPTLVVALGALAAPFAVAHVGHLVGNELAGAAAAGGVAEAMVLGPALAAAVAGAVLAASLPERGALGGQIAAAPFDRTVGVVAVMLVPAILGSLAVLPSLVTVSVTLGSELPGGRGAGLALAASAVAALPAGAVVAEGGIDLVRGGRRRPLAIACAAGAWLALGASLGAAPLGPLDVVAEALQGRSHSGTALAVPCVTGVALGLSWLLLAATRLPRPHRTSRRSRQLVRGRRGARHAAVGAILSRRGDVRLASGGALAFGIAGVAVAVAAAAPAPGAFMLGTTTALLGSVFCSLAVAGALEDGRWLWGRTPRGTGAVARATTVVAVTGTAMPVALVGTGAALAAGASRSAIGVVATVVLTGAANALVAGALLPWRESGAGDQLATFAAFAAIAVGVSLAVGLVAPRLVSAGAPDAVVAASLCALSVWAAVYRLDRRLT
jgi:hypothetical protein